MNQTTGVIGGIILIAVIALGGFFIFNKNTDDVVTNATSTPAVTDNTSGTPPDSTTPSQAGLPSAQTHTSVAPSDTTAVVGGSVTPNGAFTTYWYEYGSTSNLGNRTANQTIGSGYSAIPAPGYITGLTKATTYYFRVVAQNSFGRTSGAQYSFRTTINTPAPTGNAPVSTTRAATSVGRTSATINGTVMPNQAETNYWFEYGKNGNLGNTTALISVGNGSASAPATAPINNLDPGTIYYFRVNAQNQFGTVNGAILTFKTTGTAAAAPGVTTRSVTSIVGLAATMRGTINPNATATTYWFEYSTDQQFSSGTIQTTAQKSAGAGTNSVQVQENLINLNLNTTYYVRLVGENSAGTVRGATVSFKVK